MSNGMSNIMMLVSEIIRDKRRSEEREQDKWDRVLEFQFRREQADLDRTQRQLDRRLMRQDKLEAEANRVADKFANYNISAEDATGVGQKLLEDVTEGAAPGLAYNAKMLDLNIQTLEKRIEAYNKGISHLKEQGSILHRAAQGEKIGGIDFTSIEGLDKWMSPGEFEQFKKFALTADNPETEEVEGLGWKNFAGAQQTWTRELGGANRAQQTEIMEDKRVRFNKEQGNRHFQTFKNLITGYSDDGRDMQDLSESLSWIDSSGKAIVPSQEVSNQILQAISASTDYNDFMGWLDNYTEEFPEDAKHITEALSNSPKYNLIFGKLSTQFGDLKKEPGYLRGKNIEKVSSQEFKNTIVTTFDEDLKNKNIKTKNEAYDLYEQVFLDLEKGDREAVFKHFQTKFPSMNLKEFKGRFKPEAVEMFPEKRVMYNQDGVHLTADQIYNQLNLISLDKRLDVDVNMQMPTYYNSKEKLPHYSAATAMFSNIFGGNAPFYTAYFDHKQKMLAEKLDLEGKWNWGTKHKDVDKALIKLFGQERFELIDKEAVRMGRKATTEYIQSALKDPTSSEYKDILRVLKVNADVNEEGDAINAIVQKQINAIQERENSLMSQIETGFSPEISDSSNVNINNLALLDENGDINVDSLKLRMDNFDSTSTTIDSLKLIHENLDVPELKDKKVETVIQDSSKTDGIMDLRNSNLYQAISSLDEKTAVHLANSLGANVSDSDYSRQYVEREIAHRISFPEALANHPEKIWEEWQNMIYSNDRYVVSDDDIRQEIYKFLSETDVDIREEIGNLDDWALNSLGVSGDYDEESYNQVEGLRNILAETNPIDADSNPDVEVGYVDLAFDDIKNVRSMDKLMENPYLFGRFLGYLKSGNKTLHMDGKDLIPSTDNYTHDVRTIEDKELSSEALQFLQGVSDGLPGGQHLNTLRRYEALDPNSGQYTLLPEHEELYAQYLNENFQIYIDLFNEDEIFSDNYKGER
tara:strand:+ start:2490 stop:5429 length:2940 start_codon:yes stop_codon:yes gene_type:complete